MLHKHSSAGMVCVLVCLLPHFTQALFIPNDLILANPHNDYGLAEAKAYNDYNRGPPPVAQVTNTNKAIAADGHGQCTAEKASGARDLGQLSIGKVRGGDAGDIDPEAMLNQLPHGVVVSGNVHPRNLEQKPNGQVMAAAGSTGVVKRRTTVRQQISNLLTFVGAGVSPRDDRLGQLANGQIRGTVGERDLEQLANGQVRRIVGERDASGPAARGISEALDQHGNASGSFERRDGGGELGFGQQPGCAESGPPTMGDWWVNGGYEFLKDYVTELRGTAFVDKYGFVGGLAHCFTVVGGGNSTSSECLELQEVLGMRDSCAAQFALSGIRNFVELTKVVLTALEPAFMEAGLLIESFPYTRDWWEKYPHAQKGQFLAENIESAYRDTILSELPWKSVEDWQFEAEAALQQARRTEEGAKLADISPGSRSQSPNKWDQLFGTSVSLEDLDGSRGSFGYVAAGEQNRPEVMAEVSKKKKNAEKLSGAFRSEEFSTASRSTWNAFGRFTQGLEERLHELEGTVGVLDHRSIGGFYNAYSLLGQHALEQSLASYQGESFDLDLLGFGNLFKFVSSDTATFAPILARRIFYKALNEALISDTVYITCTVNPSSSGGGYQFGAYESGATCKRDRSGPQDLKACVEGEDVCYLYKWHEAKSGLSHRGHNTKPSGVAEWGGNPYSINPEDIILSSVSTALNGLQDFRLTSENTPFPSNDTIANASAPGMFALPVCYSDYNWNTPLDLYEKHRRWYHLPCRKSNPYCHERVPPCYCGPWGAQTNLVWQRAGIEAASADGKGSTAKEACAKLIKEKIKDPLEAYVAYCRLGIRRETVMPTGNRVAGGLVKTSGGDKHCDTVIGILRHEDYKTVGDVPADVQYAIYCKILGADGGRCVMYKELWEELKERANTFVEGMEALRG